MKYVHTLCKRGERYLRCSERVCEYMQCASVSVTIPLAVTRLGCRVWVSVMEGNV